MSETPGKKEGTAIIDGAVEGNPGRGGIGIVLVEKEEGKPLISVSKRVGDVTNNQAEWIALVELLKIAKEKGFSKIEVFTDSQLLIRQWEGFYKVRTPHLQKLYQEAKDLAKGFEEVKIFKGTRKEIKEAHRLANKAIIEGGTY